MLPSPETNSEFTPENGWLEDDEILLGNPGNWNFPGLSFGKNLGANKFVFGCQGWLVGCQGWLPPIFLKLSEKTLNEGASPMITALPPWSLRTIQEHKRRSMPI